MAETRGILTTVVTSDGMAKYLDDENKEFGKSASWEKIHFRMQTIPDNSHGLGAEYRGDR